MQDDIEYICTFAHEFCSNENMQSENRPIIEIKKRFEVFWRKNSS